jgi:hypothetical protein
VTTDEPENTEPGKPQPGQPEPVRRSSPTSRARRIGGLSRPQRPGETTEPVELTKSAEDAVRPIPEPAAGSTDTAKPAVRGLERAEAPKREPDATAEPDAESTAAASPAPVWLRWLPAGALSLAAVVMLVFFLVVSHGVWWGRASGQTVRDEVLAAAKSCTAATNSWHFNSFAADEAKGVACTTGSRTTDYKKAMEQVIKPLATKLQASQVAQVNYAGISDVSPDGNSWNILVVGQLTIRQKSNPQGRQDPFAALVRMDDVHGQWRMARIQEVAGPAAK